MSHLKELAQQQKIEDVYNKIIHPYGKPMPELMGMFYYCILDHHKRELNSYRGHFHRVIDARYIVRPGYIYEGIAFKDVHGAWHMGCAKKYFKTI